MLAIFLRPLEIHLSMAKAKTDLMGLLEQGWKPKLVDNPEKRTTNKDFSDDTVMARQKLQDDFDRERQLILARMLKTATMANEHRLTAMEMTKEGAGRHDNIKNNVDTMAHLLGFEDLNTDVLRGSIDMIYRENNSDYYNVDDTNEVLEDNQNALVCVINHPNTNFDIRLDALEAISNIREHNGAGIDNDEVQAMLNKILN